jgi:hypothetical protein
MFMEIKILLVTIMDAISTVGNCAFHFGPVLSSHSKTFLLGERNSELRIQDVYPGSRFLSFPDRKSNNSNKRGKKLAVLHIFVATNFRYVLKNMGLGSGIRDPGKTFPGSGVQKGTGFRIPDPHRCSEKGRYNLSTFWGNFPDFHRNFAVFF